MPGAVCLQGGGEFSAACRAMDAEFVRGADGPVVVTALAGEPGRDYDAATANGVRHLRTVGAVDVVAAPDARQDPEGALAALAEARLVVLPGGSPSRLLAALRLPGMTEVLVRLLADGGLVLGASAGAMVLCPWTVLPDQRTRGALAVVPGLGLVPDLLVIPHWSGGSSRGDWLRAVETAVPAGTVVLGLPEESGVLVSGSVLTAVGVAPVRLVRERRDLPAGQSWQLA